MANEQGLTFYEGKGIYDAVFQGNACALPADEVAQMPMNSNTIYHVATREPGRLVDTLTPVMVARYEPVILDPVQSYMKECLRVVPGDDQNFYMEAFVFDIPLMRSMTSGLLDGLKDDDVLVGFRFMTKKNEKHHPAIRADQFIPWALKILEKDKKVDYILTNNEPGSDTLEQFKANYHIPADPTAESIKEAKISALQHTWTYKQLTKAQYELCPGDSIKFVFPIPGQPPAVNALYRKKLG